MSILRRVFFILSLCVVGLVGRAQAPATAVPSAATAKQSPIGLAPTFREVRYGPHQRNVLNVWLAKSDHPTPVIFRIHGGGWYTGDLHPTEPAQGWLDRGISVVSIRYRMTDTDILPAPVLDAARALQFVRFKAKEWNLDPKRVVCTGGSAGACSSLWLALHDDLADPSSADPVARESTKPLGAMASNPQTTLDPRWIADHIGPEANKHRMIFQSFGATSAQEMMDNDGKYRAAIHEYSPLDHVDAKDAALLLLAGNDPAVPAKNPSHGIHHPIFSLTLKKKADAVGLPCRLVIAGEGDPAVAMREFAEGLFAAPSARR